MGTELKSYRLSIDGEGADAVASVPRASVRP
jgi:hypothetical protein